MTKVYHVQKRIREEENHFSYSCYQIFDWESLILVSVYYTYWRKELEKSSERFNHQWIYVGTFMFISSVSNEILKFKIVRHNDALNCQAAPLPIK